MMYNDHIVGVAAGREEDGGFAFHREPAERHRSVKRRHAKRCVRALQSDERTARQRGRRVLRQVIEAVEVRDARPRIPDRRRSSVLRTASARKGGAQIDEPGVPERLRGDRRPATAQSAACGSA